MISSTTSSNRSQPADPVSQPGAAPTPRSDPSPDRLSTASAENLSAALIRQPAIRSEVLERARALAADPSYPPFDVMKQIAGKILASPDLSEDES